MPKDSPKNPFGTIIVRENQIKHAEFRTAYDARKRYKKPDGTNGDKTRRCWTRAAANKALKDFALEIAQEFKDFEENKGKPKPHTFSELVEYYKKHYVKKAVYSDGQKTEGLKGNLNYLKYQIDKLEAEFGETSVREITYEDIRQFKLKFQQTKTIFKKKPAQATVNNLLAIFRRILNIGIQKQWLEVNPFKHGDTLLSKRGTTIRTRILSFDEEKRLFAACREHEVHIEKEQKSGKIYKADITVNREHLIPIMIVALDTAMRAGEIFNLRWNQVDFDKRVIYITGDAALETKTGQEGILPITQRVYDTLMAQSKSKSPASKVFKEFTYLKSFKNACKEAGIENLQFRDFRATAASRMIAAGIPKEIVKKATRHSDKTQTFEDVYVRVDVEMAQQMGESLGKHYEVNATSVNGEKKAV